VRSVFDILRDRIEQNARKAVDTFARELPEYHRMKDDRRLHATIMDFALFIRRRSVDLAEEGRQLSADDLDAIASIGQDRAAQGFTGDVQNNALSLHTGLMLREIGEASAAHDIDGLLRMAGWLSAQAGAAREAYLLGYQKGCSGRLPMAQHVQRCARRLLADDPAAPELVRGLRMPVPASYTVLVIRIPGSSAALGEVSLIEALLRRHHLPMAWHLPDAFVALVPVDEIDPWSVDPSVLSVAQDVTGLVGRPCAIGAANGQVGTLADATVIARRISEAAPLAATPRQVYTMADIFVEMALAEHRQVDHWLRSITGRLPDGPDLVATLEAYYRADMNRRRAAAAIFIHPRTLDYRLRRVRELTGLEPGSTRGVRILSTAVSRLRAGAWA